MKVVCDRNGLAKQLSRLLVRQESDYRMWKFQQKSAVGSSEKPGCLRLKIESVTQSGVHSLAHCRRLGNGDDRVSLVFTPERWERWSVRCGDIVSIYEPWWKPKQHALSEWNFRYPSSLYFVSFWRAFHRQSMEMGGVTLLLGFNLLRKERVAEVSKLSNNDSIGDGACSSASADSIAAVAENRRPSTVTVLQTWSCPNGQGKKKFQERH